MNCWQQQLPHYCSHNSGSTGSDAFRATAIQQQATSETAGNSNCQSNDATTHNPHELKATTHNPHPMRATLRANKKTTTLHGNAATVGSD